MSTDFEEKYKRWHQTLSYIKSGVRIAGCIGSLILLGVYGANISVAFLAVGLMLAEFLGIAEEWI